MTRVRGLSGAAAIDWDGDGLLDAAGSQDVNFDGVQSDALLGYNDWASLRLDQVGVSRQVRIFSGANGDFLDFGSGDFLDFGSGDFLDFGSGDFLDFGSGTYLVHFGSGSQSGDFLDFGSGDFLDFGSGDFLDFGSGVLLPGPVDRGDPAGGDFLDFGSGDFLDFGSGDFLDFGSGDFLDFGSGDFLDFGSGDFLDFGSGDFLDFGSGQGLQELDFDTAKAIGRSAPSSLKACIIGQDCAPPGPSDPQIANYGQFGVWYHRVQLRWKTPTIDQPITYRVFRITGTTISAGNVVDIGTTPVPVFVDAEELPDGVQFTYFVKAEFADAPLVSGASNLVTVTGVNAPPVAAADAYTTSQDTTLSVASPGVLGNDSDVDSPTAFKGRTPALVSGPSHGVLTLNAAGSFTYLPNSGFYGTDSFTYKANDGMWRATTIPLSGDSNVATVTITVTQVTTQVINHAPACTSFEATVKTGASVTLNRNCSDPDGDALRVTAVSTASLGTVRLNADGSFTYAATSPNVGTATVTYTVMDGLVSATGTVTLRVVYGFVNVQNLPPAAGKTFSRSGTVAMKWQWTNAAGTPLDSSLADPEVLVSVISTQAPLPTGWNGDFTVQNPGNGDSWGLPTAKNAYTWQFNWKLTYTGADGKLYELPAGKYLVRIKSRRTAQLDPNITNSDGTIGAQIVVK
jgi:VCBS repeat-containing protein